FSDGGGDQLDQYKIYNCNIGTGIMYPEQLAQAFIPSLNILTRVKLACNRYPTSYDGDLVISIRENINGNDITSISKPVNSLPTLGSFNWIEFNFPDITVIPGKTYYIVFSPTLDEISWYYCPDNPYNLGAGWVKIPPNNWYEYTNGLDHCFKTYGYNSGGNQPDLIISDKERYIPNYMVVGQQYNFNFLIKNVGETSTGSNFDVTFKKIGPNDIDWIEIYTINDIHQLNIGSEYLCKLLYTPDIPGVYNLKIIVDSNNEIIESNELNNIEVAPFYVLPTISISPSVKYNIDEVTLDIGAIVYHNVLGRYLTNNDGILTWELYDSDYNKINGYGGSSDPFIYLPSSGQWINNNNNIDGLDLGKTYIVKLIWGNGLAESEISFKKLYGYCQISGDVTDWETGNAILNGEVKLFNPFCFLLGCNPLYTTQIYGGGHYSFGPVKPGIYFIVASSPHYSLNFKVIFAEDSEIYEIDFAMVDSETNRFRLLLNSLKNSLYYAMNYETDTISSMRKTLDEKLDFSTDNLARVVLSALPSIMTSYGATIPEEFGSAAFRIGLTQTLIYAKLRMLSPELQQKFNELDENGDLDLLINTLIEGDATPENLKQNPFNIKIKNLIDEYLQDYIDNSDDIILPEDFNINRAESFVQYTNNKFSPSGPQWFYVFPVMVVVPKSSLSADKSNIRDFYLPINAISFSTLIETLKSQGKGKDICLGLKWIGAFANIVTDGLATPFVLGVDFAEEAISLNMISVKNALITQYGIDIGCYVKDLMMYPNIMKDYSDFLLTEAGNQNGLYYLDKNNVFSLSMTVNKHYDSKDYPILLSYWYGQHKKDFLDVTVTNTGNKPTKVLVYVNGFAESTENLNVNNQYKVNGIDFLIPPLLLEHSTGGQKLTELYKYLLQLKYGQLDPHYLRVESYAGASPIPLASESVKYYVLYASNVPSNSNNRILPSLTSCRIDSKVLTTSELEDFLPIESNLIDDNLSANNPFVESYFTVGNQTDRVDFYLSYPTGTYVDLSVFDE
ncbi:MAG: hypothetical protein MUO82_08875, partial [Candidatus Thermoplasmatota archaeon]|nr:hypothetical protein [Candidatus Thermoplasmatota archaeon]